MFWSPSGTVAARFIVGAPASRDPENRVNDVFHSLRREIRFFCNLTSGHSVSKVKHQHLIPPSGALPLSRVCLQFWKHLKQQFSNRFIALSPSRNITLRHHRSFRRENLMTACHKRLVPVKLGTKFLERISLIVAHRSPIVPAQGWH
jgi:hypothetical protein